MHRYLRVLLARLRIFIGIIGRIKPVAIIHLHGVFGNLTLVRTHKSQVFAIRRPCHQVGDGKLLLIHPVGNAIQDLVPLTIFRDLHLGVVIKLTNPDVVILHVSHHATVRREGRDHLLAARVRDRLHVVATHIVVVHHRFARTAINRLRLPPHQDVMSRATNLIPIKIGKGTLPCLTGIEKSIHWITCPIRILDDHIPLHIHSRVMLTIRQRAHLANRRHLTELSVCYLFQFYTFAAILCG